MVTWKPAHAVYLDETIEHALQHGLPVVALETSLVAHGLPHPIGVETALAAEAAVREAGALAATIGVLDGEIRVGLREDDLVRLATSHARKVAPQDLAPTVVAGELGGTTVAGTLAVAALCGIRFAATGGIGGVHRGYPSPPDVSSDLGELARAPVALVSSGIKSILDVEATVEALETLAVPLIGFATDRLPLFYSRDSEIALTTTVADAPQAAAVARLHWELGRAGSLLFVNPPPADDALPSAVVEEYVTTALAEARADGVRGKAVTPYILARVHELSGGRTEAVNRTLIVGNAGVAGAIAAAYAAAG